MSIASRIQQLRDIKTAIKTALWSKGQRVNDNMNTYAAAIGNLAGDSNPTAGDNDVIFIDYDGTIRYSYSRTEFLALDELPPNPVHEGLTAQGWNWSLSDAKFALQTGGFLVIGQNYITDDGKTRLYFTLPVSAPTEISLRVVQSVDGSVTVNWGDDSQDEVLSGTSPQTITHNYEQSGDYIITFDVASGASLSLGGGYDDRLSLFCHTRNTDTIYASYNARLFRKIELGLRTDIEYYGLNGGVNINSVTIPKNFDVKTSQFQGTDVAATVIPVLNANRVEGNHTNPSKFVSAPRSNFSYIVKLPRIQKLHNLGYYQINNAFRESYCLVKGSIPNTVTSISGYSLSAALVELVMCSTTPPTIVSNTTYILTNCKIYVPYSADHSVLAAYKAATGWVDIANQIYELDANGNIPSA